MKVTLIPKNSIKEYPKPLEFLSEGLIPFNSLVHNDDWRGKRVLLTNKQTREVYEFIVSLFKSKEKERKLKLKRVPSKNYTSAIAKIAELREMIKERDLILEETSEENTQLTRKVLGLESANTHLTARNAFLQKEYDKSRTRSTPILDGGPKSPGNKTLTPPPDGVSPIPTGGGKVNPR